MKLKGWCGGIGFLMAFLVFATGLFSVPTRAAFLYKSYIIRQAGSQDILCDPYIVQKDDYVLKIFRQRGEISHADFPDFLKIFKRVNPQVEDVDRILPGQRIFIPLKKLEPGSVPDQERGVVTIPFVTQTEIGDILKEHAAAHTVIPGDTVSRLLAAHFGRYGTKSYNEALTLFKALNPQVKNVNLIMVGQTLWLPDESIRNELWYESLFDASGNVATMPPAELEKPAKKPVEQPPAEVVEKIAAAEEEKPIEETKPVEVVEAPPVAVETPSPVEVVVPEPTQVEVKETVVAKETAVAGTLGVSADPVMDAASITALAEAAGLLDGRLYQKGTYYFPRSGQSDLQLNLARYPVLETRDGDRVLLTSAEGSQSLSPEMLSVLRNFWKNLAVAELPPKADLPGVLDAVTDSLTAGSISEERVLTDEGIQVTLRPRWMLEAPGKNGVSLAIVPIETIAERAPRPLLDYLETLGIELKEVVLSDASGNADTPGSTGVSFGQVPVLDGSLDRQAFVRNFFGILGVNYQPNATVSFGYAGIQIQAVTNTLNRPDGRLVLVDFESLHGEAVKTLEKAGFELVHLPPEGLVADLIPQLLAAVDMTCETDPIFTSTPQAGSDNITLFIPGFMALKDETPQTLLATVPVHDDLVRFFKERKIDVVTLTNVPDKQPAGDITK
jgi:hypothetical protein